MTIRHSDDLRDESVLDVFGYSKSKAEQLMMEVHQTGRSVVWTGARESAEMYVQQLQSRHLRATLERVDG